MSLPNIDDFDYFHASQEITLDGNSVMSERERCMRVTLVDDSRVEENERFTVQLSSPLETKGILELRPNSASVLIIGATRCGNYSIINDNIPEGTEDFRVSLLTEDTDRLDFVEGHVRIFIIDDDGTAIILSINHPV